MSTAIVIPPREIHIRVADLDRVPAHPEWLSPEEQQRSSRFVVPLHQRRYLASRTILRSLLAEYLGDHPARVPMAATLQGKPFVPGSELRFNLSHSDGAGLYGFSCEAEIGVDIEKIDARSCTEEVARLVFTPDELERWMKLDTSERTAVFFRVWTRKEAIVKATGEGLGRATDTFAVAWTPEPARVCGLWLLPLAAPHGYQASLAAIAPDCPTVAVGQLTMLSEPRGGVH